jgi:hypothetical protein
MAILGALLKNGVKLGKAIEQENKSPFKLQKKQLKKLLKMSMFTEIGKKYHFDRVLAPLSLLSLSNKREFYNRYKKNVPIYSYNRIYNEFWHKSLDGKADVTWPGKVKYFALSSGTSEAATKHIPVTKHMIKAIRKTSLRQVLALHHYHLPSDIYTKGILMLGGSTHLHYNGTYFEGDLSGIGASNLPFWFQHFYKPGRRISRYRDWNEKLEEIVKAAPNWDIGFIVGVPAWMQILLEMIIERYKLKNIHEIWPNLSVYTHGGVSFEPYKKGFEKLLGRPIKYIETYLASEGFIAFQDDPNSEGMKMILNNGIFYEFVPFNSDNFDADGEIKDKAQTLIIDEVEEGKEYALLLSSCAGAWRYLIGDVVRFLNKKKAEIVITGRTKHYLSLCGEHLSVDNMNKAIEMVSNDLNIDIKEFAVAGIPHQTLFAHHWWIGCDSPVDQYLLKNKLDDYLKELNDDYKVERIAALKDVFLTVLPTEVFYAWMESKGKVGSQNKFPRVLKNGTLDSWVDFIREWKTDKV